ncbi:hypothetical protein GALL_139730 [mine drainage metagenome]|uniref:Transmembrane protein n=1 Tax=mine drainage metagenome TaxID=410659 RepID=A0A1J5S5R5_9ZZZZ
MLTGFAAQPLYAPLSSALSALADAGQPPDCVALNRLAAARDLRSGGGAPLRFIVPGGSGLAYEERIYWLGEVETRPGNWHDCFNALVWLAYPKTKAALNTRHHFDSADGARRGPLRDALTQFDECGGAVVSSRLDLWEEIRAHRWKEVFWSRRADVLSSLRVYVFGHASFDMLRTPHLGLCAKALFLHVDHDWLAAPPETQLADVDARMAQRFSGDFSPRPRDFQPLPLLGIPGATADNGVPAYYDSRQFRPLRLIQS